MFTQIKPFRGLVCVAFFVILPSAIGENTPSIRPGARVRQKDVSDHDSAHPEHLVEGFTEPYADINLAAAEMGILSHVAVKDGDLVTSGQLLANLDDSVLRASLDVARAGMNAEGEMRTAATQLDLKKVEREKLRKLFQREYASQKELDRIDGEVRIAETRIQSVKEDMQIRRLEYARIEAQLRQRQIRSPIDGVVVEVRKDQGEFVSPSDPVVARVVQLDPLLVIFSVPVARRSELLEGNSAPMTIGPSSVTVRGVVEHVSPTADASSGTFRVKVRLANPDGRWHGGERSVLLLDSETPGTPPVKKIAKRTR